MELPILKGTLDLLVLKALQREPLHGFEITTWIESHSKETLGFDDSAIYHALYRMERRGWVESSWGVTENRRKARYYQVTPAGERHLQRETELLLRYSQAVVALLTEPT